ncbi:unnamed protein product [Paramecium pentaurelia]|uniref:Uncharacterized protein n=1 Tax=Paramecium pentaurelia TaxID=43138 RepID=A0A8S1V3F0_9CILI|nr:unnamed protein product [Paramecium pentaurelia]
MDEEFKQKYSFAALQKYVSEKEKDKDKAIFKLWNGMNLDELGMSVQDNKLPGQPTKIISPFIDDNATQPDPLSKPHDWIKQKLMPRQNSVNRKKEMFSQFSEETNFYIFYNVMDEEQQLWALYERMEVQFKERVMVQRFIVDKQEFVFWEVFQYCKLENNGEFIN